MHAEYLYNPAANHYSYLSQQGSCSEYNVLVMQRLHARPTRLSSTVSLAPITVTEQHFSSFSLFIPLLPRASRVDTVLLKDRLCKTPRS